MMGEEPRMVLMDSQRIYQLLSYHLQTEEIQVGAAIRFVALPQVSLSYSWTCF